MINPGPLIRAVQPNQNIHVTTCKIRAANLYPYSMKEVQKSLWRICLIHRKDNSFISLGQLAAIMQEFTTERGKKQNATQCHHVTFNACIAEISPYQKPVMFEFFNCGSQLSQSCYLLKRLFKKQKACLFSKAIKFSSTFSQNHFLTLRKQ